MCCHIYIYIIFIIIVVSWFLLVFVLLSFVVLVFFWVVVSHRLGSCSFVLVLSLYVWSIGFSGGYSIQYYIIYLHKTWTRSITKCKRRRSEWAIWFYYHYFLLYDSWIRSRWDESKREREKEKNEKNSCFLCRHVMMMMMRIHHLILWVVLVFSSTLLDKQMHI